MNAHLPEVLAMALQPFAPPQSVVHQVMARPICPFPSPASCLREMKRIGEQESAEDEYLSHVAMLEDAAMHIRQAQKALTKAGAVDDDVCTYIAAAIVDLGGKP